MKGPLQRQDILDVLTRQVTPGIKLTALADELGLRKHQVNDLRTLLLQLVEEGALQVLSGGAFALAPVGRNADPRGRFVPPTKRAEASRRNDRARSPERTSSPERRGERTSSPERRGERTSPRLAKQTQPWAGRSEDGRGPVRGRPVRPPAPKEDGWTVPDMTPEPPSAAPRRSGPAPVAPVAPMVAAAPALDSKGSDDRVVGRITIHPAGYGFVATDDGQTVFVPAKYRGLSLDGDQVSLVTWAGVRGVEGRVEAVLARGRARLTGILRRAGAMRMYLEPDDPRIAADYGRVALEGVELGKEGDAVVVEITQYPTLLQQAIAGRVQKVLGDPEDPRTEIEKILAVSSIPLEFPEAVQAQAQATPQTLGPDDFADRIDLRSRRFCTIDPETARDFDDALCVEDGPHGGPRVWVAVADVAHYVRWGDALDREAELRGVSVYLPDRVISMLPIQLSAGICSLNPEVDRCAMVVRLDFDPAGGVVEAGLAAAVIRSHARLDYPGVAAALGGDFRGRREAYRPWAAELRRLADLSMQMRARRRARGALELEIGEPKVVLDADDPRLVRDVVRAKGDAAVKGAYELVEEFMIAANEAVGRYFRHRGATTVWRVHSPPKEERRRSLAELLAAYGIATDADELATPLGMKHVLDELSQLPAARSLSFLVLRTLTQAVWDTVPVGHFGLASGDYLHFTSPIRRYPDLLVHRLLKHYLHKEGQASGGGYQKAPPSTERLTELAAASSAHERRAMEAERETVSMYRAYLMRDQVGEQFQGVISAVTSFGVFVEIETPFVEGLIRLDSLADDAYVFDDVHLRLTGRRTGKQLALGDEVTVALRDVSVLRRRIELELVATAAERTASPEELAAARKRTPRPTTSERPVHGRRGTGPTSRRGRVRHAETVEVAPSPQVPISEEDRPRRRSPARTEEGWALPPAGLAAKRRAGRAVAKAAAPGRGQAKGKGGLRLGVSARLTRGPGRDEDAPRPRKGKLPKAKGKGKRR